MTTFFSATASGLTLSVRAKPRASKPGVERVEGGEVVVRLASAPADGAANEELVKTLAKALGVPKTAVKLAGGETSRHKRVHVSGLDADTLGRLALKWGEKG